MNTAQRPHPRYMSLSAKHATKVTFGALAFVILGAIPPALVMCIPLFFSASH